MQTFNNKSNNSPFRVLQCDTGGQMPYATGKAFGRGKLFANIETAKAWVSDGCPKDKSKDGPVVFWKNCG